MIVDRALNLNEDYNIFIDYSKPDNALMLITLNSRSSDNDNGIALVRSLMHERWSMIILMRQAKTGAVLT